MDLFFSGIVATTSTVLPLSERNIGSKTDDHKNLVNPYSVMTITMNAIVCLCRYHIR